MILIYLSFILLKFRDESLRFTYVLHVVHCVDLGVSGGVLCLVHRIPRFRYNLRVFTYSDSFSFNTGVIVQLQVIEGRLYSRYAAKTRVWEKTLIF